MALTFTKLFAPQMLAGTAGSLFPMPTSPATSLLRNGRVLLTNTDTSARAVTLYAVPNGGTASATNQFLPAVSIGPGMTMPVDVPQLGVGDSLQGFADVAGKVNIQALDGIIQS